MLQLKNRPKNYFLISFLCCFGLAFLMFLPFLIMDRGFFLYCGDFNSQQIPFYTHCTEQVHNGFPSFSWATDLGSGFVPGYSFYTLGSVIFWLATLFPVKAIPFLMVPLLCLKFGIMGMGAFGFARRYVQHSSTALFGALLYTFSGFAVYNIFFNHFIEAVMLFPFLLWSMDDFFYKKQRAAFPLIVALSLLNNFFFFFGNAVFCALYFLCKLLSRSYRTDGKTFLWFCLEAVLGFCMGIVLLIPTVLDILGNPRTMNFANGMDLLLYGNVQKYFAILSSLFLPPDPPYSPNLFVDGGIKWSSLSLYLPLVSCCGVWAYLRRNKGSAFNRILGVSLVMALVPILNSAFYAFNSSYYARWFFMPLLIMAVCSVIALEKYPKEEIMRACAPVALITLLHLAFVLVPNANEETGIMEVGVVKDPILFLCSVLTALIGVGLVWLIIQLPSRHRAIRLFCIATAAFSVIYGAIHLAEGKLPQLENDAHYRQETYDDRAALLEALPQDHFYRIDAYECYQNMGLFLNKSCLQAFNSTVAPSIMEFYPSTGIKRDVSSKPDLSKFALRGLLSVEYMLVPDDHVADFEEEGYTQDFRACSHAGSYTIYHYDPFVPMGFTYEYYMPLDELDDFSPSQCGNLYMRALILDPEQELRYRDLLRPLPEARRYANSYSAYLADCSERRAYCCDSFTAEKNGFTAHITLPRENLVFFSVPYSKGFTATVNGQEVPVEKVSHGMMAVLCQQGSNDIVFTYRTPGLALGAAVSLTACGVYLIYALLLYKKKKQSCSAKAS